MLDISFLCADLVNDWLSESMPIIRDVLLVLIGIGALIVILAVMFQTSSGQDATAITGATDSYYAKNKGTSIDDKLNKLTKIVSIVMVVLIILYFVSRVVYKG